MCLCDDKDFVKLLFQVLAFHSLWVHKKQVLGIWGSLERSIKKARASLVAQRLKRLPAMRDT